MTDALLSPDAPLDAPPDAPVDVAPPTMTGSSSAAQRVDHLREVLDNAGVVMLTAEHEGLHSRPMTLLNIDDAGGLWFLVDGGEMWVQALIDRPMVDVSADLHTDGRWVSVSGVAVLSDDRVAIHALWTPTAKAFWDSADDPSIRVLRVDPTVIDVWHGTPSPLGRVLAIGKAVLTGETSDTSEDDPSEAVAFGGMRGHEHLVFAEP